MFNAFLFFKAFLVIINTSAFQLNLRVCSDDKQKKCNKNGDLIQIGRWIPCAQGLLSTRITYVSSKSS